MTTNNNTQTNTLERISMNIVYQIVDALDEKIKEGKDIVTARQETNDMCIDFTKSLINEMVEEAYVNGKKHGFVNGVRKFMSNINDNPDTALDIIEVDTLEEEK